MASPYAAVTVMDGTTSVGLADATAYLLDYRFFDSNYPVSFVGTQTSVGTGDNIKVYVSPDAKGNVAGTFVQIESFTTTAFTGVIQGNWAAVKFVGNGSGGNKRVVALMGGFSARNDQVVNLN